MPGAYKPTAIKILLEKYPDLPKRPKIDSEGKKRDFHLRFLKAWSFVLLHQKGATCAEIGKTLDPPLHRARIQQLIDFAAREYLASQGIDIESVRSVRKPIDDRTISIEDAIANHYHK